MKKIYQKPSIKIRKVVTNSLMAASGSGNSLVVGGNTDITSGKGDPPTTAGAKSFSIWEE